MRDLDFGDKFTLVLTLILIILCIVLGILAWIHERENDRRISDPFWYSDRVRGTTMID